MVVNGRWLLTILASKFTFLVTRVRVRNILEFVFDFLEVNFFVMFSKVILFRIFWGNSFRKLIFNLSRILVSNCFLILWNFYSKVNFFEIVFAFVSKVKFFWKLVLNLFFEIIVKYCSN